MKRDRQERVERRRNDRRQMGGLGRERARDRSARRARNFTAVGPDPGVLGGIAIAVSAAAFALDRSHRAAQVPGRAEQRRGSKQREREQQ